MIRRYWILKFGAATKSAKSKAACTGDTRMKSRDAFESPIRTHGKVENSGSLASIKSRRTPPQEKMEYAP